MPFLMVTMTVSADGLSEAGNTDTLDGRGLFWVQTDNDKAMYVNDDGGFIYYSIDNGEHTEIWNASFSVSVKCVRIDANAQWLAVGHNTGALLIAMGNQEISENISTPVAVTAIDFDIDGDLWLGHATEPRRAVEYRGNATTGEVTDQHFGGVKELIVMSDGKIVTAGNDKKIFVYDPDTETTQSITEDNSFETMKISDNEQYLYLTTSAGEVIRYETTTWTAVTLQLGSSMTTQLSYSSLSNNNTEIYAGSTNFQKLWVVDTGTMSMTEEITVTGATIGALRGDRGEMYVVSAVNPNSLVRLFDIDSDNDGTVDSNDEFPNDNTQSADADGDGYGDNAEGNNGDAFPDNPTQWNDTDGDGYGDNPEGTNADSFPENSEQWADSDGDGFGDNKNGLDGDQYPDDSTQWADSDSDGKGDNVNGTNGDACPTMNGFSIYDRQGCPDGDGDGWSNPDSNWTYDFNQCESEQTNCADNFPNDGTQWADRDGDGYGDNSDGTNADACPTIIGNSTKIVLRSVASDGVVTWSTTPAFGCVDSDGDGFADYGDEFKDDPDEFVDIDGDGIGSKGDYDDTNSAVQTFDQYCILNVDDNQTDCLAVRNSDYQQYRTESIENGDEPLEYNNWIVEQNLNTQNSQGSDSIDDAIGDALTYGGLGFVGLTAAILLVSGIVTIMKKRKAAKAYGNIEGFNPSDAMEELSAEESGETFTTSGGVTDQEMWDDEIPDIELASSVDSDSIIDDDEMKVIPELTESTGELDDESSLEEMAGEMADTTDAAATEIPDENDAGTNEEQGGGPPEAPPIPDSGLPEGWTEEQWRWYGHQWLEKNS